MHSLHIYIVVYVRIYIHTHACVCVLCTKYTTMLCMQDETAQQDGRDLCWADSPKTAVYCLDTEIMLNN